MFIIESNPNREMKIVLRRLKQIMGIVPPHFELFATINPKRFQMFLEEMNYFIKHPHIHPDLFAMIRFYISAQNNFKYCYDFNHALLLQRGYSSDGLHGLEVSVEALPLDTEHQALFAIAVEAISDSDSLTYEKIEALKKLGWSDADLYDVIDHGASMFKFSKVLRAYMKV